MKHTLVQVIPNKDFSRVSLTIHSELETGETSVTEVDIPTTKADEILGPIALQILASKQWSGSIVITQQQFDLLLNVEG